MNIHSHLSGAVLFVALLFTFPSVYFVHYESTTWADKAVFSIFLCAAIFCLFSSAFYHTFSAHSPGVRTHFRSCGTSLCHGSTYSANDGSLAPHRLLRVAMRSTTAAS